MNAQKINNSVCRLVGVLSLSCVSVHCAARGLALTSSQVTDLSRADALVRDGCYRCLQEASEIYTSLMRSPARRSPQPALRGAFDVTLLLALREKEIGLPADASMARARALLSKFTAGEQTRPLEELIEAAEAIMGDSSGLEAEERRQRDQRLQQAAIAAATTGQLRNELQKRATSDLIAAYVALALDCDQPRNRPPSTQAPHTPMVEVPLMRYRVAICSSAQPISLTRLREEGSRWTETFFFEGKYEMGSPARPADPVRAAALLTLAGEAFPESIGIQVMLARAHEMNGDFAKALASFDQILALKPTHVDARLGRVRNLTYLGRADEGIAAATAIIDLGAWHVGDAFYWRAWNQYQVRRLEPAWADVQEAMRLLANTSVYALAGSIAYARRDLDTAIRHFDAAFEMDPTNCPAASSAALVHTDRDAWHQAAEMYSKATNCFAVAANVARTDLARLEQAVLEPALKATRLATARKRIESAEDLSARSALDAAQSYLHVGQNGLALTFVDRAEKHPVTHARALALRARIAGIQ